MKTKLLFFALLFSWVGWGQATLPLSRTTWNATATGWTDTPLDSYITTFACSTTNGAKFDTTGDLKIINFIGAPNQLNFVVKSNTSNSTSILLVEESNDGVTYSSIVNLTGSIGLPTTCTTKGPYNLLSTSRYVRWTFTFGSSNLTMDDVEISALPTAAPTVTSSIVDIIATYGTAFANYTIVANQSPTSYSATGLPAGMTINTTTGLISGTSTQVGTFPVSISATNTIGTGTSVIKNYIINPKPLTITGLLSANKVYDGTTTAILTGTAALSGVVGSDVVTLTGTPISNYSQSNVGTSLVITTSGYSLSGADAGKYTITQPSVTIRSITKKPLTISGITANNKVFDNTTAATLSGTASLVGVIGADVVTLGGTASASFANVNVANNKIVTVTGYTISGAQAANYSITQPSLQANITQAPQILTFSALPDQMLSGTTFTLNATSTSGNPITYSSSNTAVATVLGNVVTMLSLGSTIFTASQAGSTNFSAAADVTQNQNIIIGLPEIRVERATNANIPTGSAPGTGFDTQFAMQTIGNSQTKTYNIRNVGGATLNVSALTLAGLNPSDFSVNAATPFAIAPPSGFVTFTVTFVPTAIGNRLATISIANNDSDENPFTFDVQGTGNCPTTTVTATPSTGPVGTKVTITSTNSVINNLSGATASFGGITAIVLSSSAFQMVVVIPAGAGNTLTISNVLGCTATLPYAIIKDDKTSCEGSGGTNFTDLIISEVYDSENSNVWHMELFNPTTAAIDLGTSNYTLKRFGDVGNATPSRTITLTGIVNAGSTFYMQLGDSGTPCAGPYDFTASGPGINSNDEIRLTKNGVDVDVVYCPIDTNPDPGIETVGYSIRRISTTTGPTMIYNATNWSVLLTESCTDLDVFQNTLGIAPTVTTQPTYTSACGITSITLTSLGAEGFAGGNGLEYVWFQVAPSTATWSEVSIISNFADTDANPATLNIADISGLNNYQFYCQIRENTATCFTATVAVIISNNPSIWNGTTWVGGTPDLNKSAIIDGTYVTDTLGHGNFSCCNLTVNSGVGISLTISSNGHVEVQNEVTNNGIITVLDNASLVQINNSAINSGSGTTNVTRITPAFDKFDYTYWSSPIKDDNLGTRFAAWNLNQTYNFVTENYSDQFNDASYPQTTGIPDAFDDTNDDWVNIASPTSTTMTAGVGYAVMGGTSGSFPRAETVTFSGNANNGIIPFALKQSANLVETADDYNLVGNPYPSSIKADDFIKANILPLGSGNNISGTLYFWTHGGNLQPALTNPGPNVNNYNANEYALYNLTGSIGTAAGNPGNPISDAPNGFIGTGQAFFVEAENTSDLIFNNSMRNRLHTNTQFFRPSNIETKDRLWLNFQNVDNMFSQQLIGYLPETTLDFDFGYDGRENKTQNYVSFYSFMNAANNDLYKIQSRSDFNANDFVKLGFSSAVSGQSSISIDKFEGVFNNQNIYLQDNLLNITHDLKQTPYSFTTNYGTFNDRFVLKYVNTILANEVFPSDVNNFKIAVKDNKINLKSDENIKIVEVFDLLGRRIFDNQSINSKTFSIENLNIKNQTLIVKTKLSNGEIVTKKVIL